jgi:hypothetical protein
VSLIGIYAIVAWSALVVLLLWRLIRGGRADGPDRTDAVNGHSVDYWVEQVDSWLAQLAEIRNLSTLRERDDRPTNTSTVMTAITDHAQRTLPTQTLRIIGARAGGERLHEVSGDQRAEGQSTQRQDALERAPTRPAPDGPPRHPRAAYARCYTRLTWTDTQMIGDSPWASQFMPSRCTSGLARSPSSVAPAQAGSRT